MISKEELPSDKDAWLVNDAAILIRCRVIDSKIKLRAEGLCCHVQYMEHAFSLIPPTWVKVKLVFWSAKEAIEYFLENKGAEIMKRYNIAEESLRPQEAATASLLIDTMQLISRRSFPTYEDIRENWNEFHDDMHHVIKMFLEMENKTGELHSLEVMMKRVKELERKLEEIKKNDEKGEDAKRTGIWEVASTPDMC